MTWNFILYLLYGLAFFTLGVAILARDIRLSELGIARIIWLLAVFGIVHGFHEWLELLEQLNPDIKTLFFSSLRRLVVSISFLCLLYFGLFLNIITLYGDHALKTTPSVVKSVIGVSALFLVVVATYLDIDSGADMNIRRFLAFPGGLLSGIGLVMYSRTVRPFSKNVATNFILAGSFMIIYAFLTGIVPSDAVIFFGDVKVILFRGVSAFLIMFFTIRALSVFSLEQRALIDEKLQRFSQSEKLASMGILAAGIAHEINNPLTNVSLNLEMLKDLVGDDVKITRKIEAIERNNDRASRIAKELLHFSREKETALQPTDLNQVLTSTTSLLKNQELSSIIQLQLHNVPKIMGISWKLEEAFLNLLLNSIDACTKEDRITIETLRRNDYVIVTIRDSGHGIAKENIAKVFDPFFTTKEIGKGTGLGLAVCYNIIKQHGAEISLTSNMQQGTRVAVSFPVLPNDN